MQRRTRALRGSRLPTTSLAFGLDGHGLLIHPSNPNLIFARVGLVDGGLQTSPAGGASGSSTLLGTSLFGGESTTSPRIRQTQTSYS